MKTSDFDYNLPKELIAQKPVEPRDQSRLLVIDKTEQTYKHKTFVDIIDELGEGDVIVWNNSKVFKARLYGDLVSNNDEELLEHDEKIEIFLVRAMENKGVWKVLARPGKHVRIGSRVRFADDFYCEPMIKEKDGTILVQFPYDEDEVIAKANQYGEIPLPPYIKQETELEKYQTVYNNAEKEGSVAAPTAGFHFTPELIEKLQTKGVQFEEVTLHVGLGTFLPVKSDTIEDHVMHSEVVELNEATANAINKAKESGKRIVAVGTTSVRTLEGVAALGQGKLCAYRGDIDIFITPGFDFNVVDALITNFHLPKSTLLMLVAAFVGDRQFMLEFYKEAVEQKYRFFSFGDAMFIK